MYRNESYKALEPAPENAAALCGSFYGGAVQLKRYVA